MRGDEPVEIGACALRAVSYTRQTTWLVDGGLTEAVEWDIHGNMETNHTHYHLLSG